MVTRSVAPANKRTARGGPVSATDQQAPPVATRPAAPANKRSARRAPARGKEQQAGPTSTGLDSGLQINVHVHLPATATPKQLDAIIASMAKHLGQKTLVGATTE